MNPLILPKAVLDEASAFFRQCGAYGHEGTAMIKNGPAGPNLVIPAQQPWRSGIGVSVEVTREGQMQLATALGLEDLYVARIHSHPNEAFHSAADDANPVLTHEGALSIVVPYFGLGLCRGLAACAVLRREGGQWRTLPVGSERDRWILVQPGETS